MKKLYQIKFTRIEDPTDFDSYLHIVADSERLSFDEIERAISARWKDFEKHFRGEERRGERFILFSTETGMCYSVLEMAKRNNPALPSFFGNSFYSVGEDNLLLKIESLDVYGKRNGEWSKITNLDDVSNNERN